MSPFETLAAAPDARLAPQGEDFLFHLIPGRPRSGRLEG